MQALRRGNSGRAMRRAPSSLVLGRVEPRTLHEALHLYCKLLNVVFSTVEVLRLYSTPSFVYKF